MLFDAIVLAIVVAIAIICSPMLLGWRLWQFGGVARCQTISVFLSVSLSFFLALSLSEYIYILTSHVNILNLSIDVAMILLSDTPTKGLASSTKRLQKGILRRNACKGRC